MEGSDERLACGRASRIAKRVRVTRRVPKLYGGAVMGHGAGRTHEAQEIAAGNASDPGGVVAANLAIANESPIETMCRVLCEAALVAMVVMMIAEVVGRALFDFSFQVTDELCGYLLIIISFLSLPVC